MKPTNSERHDRIPNLSHSRLQKYITCPEQYRLYYLERLRPKREAAARVFGAVMHLALEEYFRKERDPLATFRTEWNGCREFELRYSQRESWQKLSEIGEALLGKFLAEEARKFEQIFAVEAQFHIGVSNVAAPLIGTLDLIAQLEGKKTLVEFKTGANDWGEHDVLLSDQLTIYGLAEPEVEQTAICVFVKKRVPEIVWHFTERTPGQQVEYLRKLEILSQHIADHVFYKRVGFWCRQCEFLPVCTGNEKKAKETLVRLPTVRGETPCMIEGGDL
jgi:RecB family exonuclease